MLKTADPKNIRVLVVMPLGEINGGGELMLLHLLQHGRNSGIEWMPVFFETGSLVERIEKLGFHTIIIPAGRLREVGQYINTVTEIARIARRESADLILSWMAKAHLYSCFSGMITGLPSIWFQLSIASAHCRMDRVVTMLPARGVLTLSRAGDHAQKRLHPVRPTRMVYPGVEIDRFDPNQLPPMNVIRKKLNLPVNTPIVGIVGRLQRWKGIHTLIEAMPDIRNEYPNTLCVVVGGAHDLEPDYPTYLDKLIEKHDLRDCVMMAGLQSNVPEWMQAMDVVVHASEDEPFGIVIIEAMALGKPVVATDTAGPAEIITHGENGILTPYGNADALAKAILVYLDNRNLASEFGAAARKRALEFSVKKYAGNVIAAIKDFMEPDQSLQSAPEFEKTGAAARKQVIEG